jgi:hypothetical protein
VGKTARIGALQANLAVADIGSIHGIDMADEGREPKAWHVQEPSA